MFAVNILSVRFHCHLKHLFFCLSKLSNVQKIDLSHNNLGETVNNIISLSEYISSHSNILEIYLCDNNLGKTENNMKYFCEGLSNLSNLQI